MRLLLADGADINGAAPPLGRTPLHTAAAAGLVHSVDFLIRAGADLNRTDEWDLTPLMIACSRGRAKGRPVALRLIEAGADVRYVRAEDQMTALKFAVESCLWDVVQALIDRGAEVDGPPGTEKTALMMAALTNNIAALKLLVKNGADLSRCCKLPDPRGKLPDARGQTALDLAEAWEKREAAAYLRRVRAGRARGRKPGGPKARMKRRGGS
jgi:ankyrin repeat protein